MVFWVVAALMSALAALSVLWPLVRRNRAGDAPDADPQQDMAVYKDQIAEVDRDRARGLIAGNEAVAARTEIARRLLKAADSAKAGPPARAVPLARKLAAVVALCVPFAALAVYERLGAPDMPDRPIEARLNAPEARDDLPAMMRKVELYLGKNPDDAKGWQVLVPLYMRTGQADKAIEALHNIARINGDSAALETEIASAAIAAQGGDPVSPRVSAALAKALVLDPKDPKARFMQAYMLSKQGKIAEAKAGLSSLLADAPAGAPWRGNVESALAALDAPAQGAVPGPTAADVNAAGGMSPAERQAMIAGMVQKLSDDLDAHPANKEGWLRLIRAYTVLARKGDAVAAAGRARKALAGDAAAVAEIDAAAKGLE